MRGGNISALQRLRPGSMFDAVYSYYRYYLRSASLFWNNMGPMEYGSILIAVGVVGWFLMRGKLRR